MNHKTKIGLVIAIGLAVVIGLSTAQKGVSVNYDADISNDITTTTNLVAANWIHATAIVPQYPGNIVKTDRRSWGTYFYGKNNTVNVFLIPIPTTVVADWKRTELKRVMAFWKTDGNAKITDIFVTDGKNGVQSFQNLNLAGDYSDPPIIGGKNGWDINPPKTMGTGLVIAVYVKFGNKDNVGYPYPGIYFASAGADLYN